MERICFYLTGLLLIVAPLYYAGRGAVSELVIEVIGLALLVCVIWSGLYSKKLFLLFWVYLFLCLALALLFLVPVPIDVWEALPGRQLYISSFEWLANQGIELSSFSVSVIRSETIYSLLILIPCLAVFLSALSLRSEHIKRLVYVFLFVAAAQGILGLIQYASDDPFFVFGMEYSGRAAQGMFINRDHFAAFMEMALPVSLGLMLYSVGRQGKGASDLNFKVNDLLSFAFIAITVFLAAVFTRSRTGVFIVLLIFLMSSLIFSRHIGGKRSAGWAAAFGVIAFGVAGSIGLIPVLNRFVGEDPLEDGRWPIFETTLTVIREFFPLGSGPGTFAEVYRAFQPVEQAFYANHAHNEYLELLVEMGAAGAFVIVGFLLLYVYGWFRLSGNVWDRMRFIQVAAGLAILSILLHCLLDFILHTTANFIVFAFLVGVFFRPKELAEHRQSRR